MLTSVGQVYPRSLDFDVLSALVQLTAAPSNLATTIRLMAGNELVTEGFQEGQVGSSAMPHKMNTRSCERVNGLAVVTRGYLSMVGELAGDQWNEGDVSCSVVRRVALPDAFFAVDGLFQTFLTVLDEFGAFPAVIQRELDRYLPFLSTTKVLMAAVRNGVGRETAHEAIKEAAVGTALAMRKGQADNDVFAKLAADERLGLTAEQLDDAGGRPDHLHRCRGRPDPGGLPAGGRGRRPAPGRGVVRHPARSSKEGVTLDAEADMEGHDPRFRRADEHDPEQQFRALYDGNFAAVLGYTLRRVEQPTDAADVVSEVFLVAWRRLDEAPPGDGRPWLFGIARHVLSNYHRGLRRRQRLGGRLRDTLAHDVVPDPANGVAEWDRIRQVLLKLRPDDRELLMLVGWDGLTPTEAAGVVGIAPGHRPDAARARPPAVPDLLEPGCDAPATPGHVQAVPFEHVIGESR